MKVWETLKAIIKKIFGGSININKQENCNNSPIINGDNNSVQIGSPPPIVSKEQPINQKPGEFWYQIIDTEDKTDG